MLTPSLPLTALAIQALVSRFTQSSRVLRLHTPLGDDVLLAESLHGEEAIDTGYRLRVSALATDAALPLKSLLGQPVLLELLAGPFQDVRPFHGHVTAAEMTGANGGLARYVLTIEPWTAFLALGRDSRVFQDQTVVDIIDAVFSAYDGKGRLAPAWRFQVDRSLYPQRSLTTQYQESDLAFVRRLLSEEGLFGFFEHAGDPAGAALGAHTLVIADSNDAFIPNTQPVVRYTQPGAVMVEDSIDRWRTETRLATNAIELRSWDYRARQVRAVGAAAHDALELRSSDVPGVYAYTSREHGERIAERQLQALEAGKIVHAGAGTVRTFMPGTTFTLAAHGGYDGVDSTFLLVPPTRPSIRHDNGFLDKFRKRAPTTGDRLQFAKWLAMLEGSEALCSGGVKTIAPPCHGEDLSDANAAYRHFLFGKGTDRTINYERFLLDDASGRQVIPNVLQDFQRHIEVIGHDRGKFSVTSDAYTVGNGGIAPYPTTVNWQKAIGAHFLWVSADVSVSVVDHSEILYTADVTFHMEDRYNFNPGQHDIATGIPDSANGIFEITGLAHQYTNFATVQRKISWREGEHSGATATDAPTSRQRKPADNRRVRNRI